MKYLDVLTAAGGRCSGGDPFLWDCYGPNAQYSEFRDVNGDGYSHCVFDTKTYEVYEVHVETPVTSNVSTSALRWFNPQYVLAYTAEANARQEDMRFAWDDVLYTDVLGEEEILDHVRNVGEGRYEGLPIANREDIPVDDFMEATMFVDDPEENSDTFIVALDVKYTFEVTASDYEEAISKAKEFRKTMPSGWGDVSGVNWMDTEVIKETISREISE